MKKFELCCIVEEYASVDELNESERTLIGEAEKALKNAYAPFSDFRVGCALLMEDNTVIVGNNQENSAYPSGLCAERVAFFHARAMFPDKKIIAMAVTTSNPIDDPVAPCGSCRQVMAEYELRQNSDIRVLLSHPGKKVFAMNSIASLLPLRFIL